jgi:hypothetical protein
MQHVVIEQEGIQLEEVRAAAVTCVRRHAVDETEELLFLRMLGLAA